MTHIFLDGNAGQFSIDESLPDELKRESILGEIFLRHHNKSIFLLEAPAGYGKSTLIQQWRRALTEKGERSFYLCFSRKDNNPSSLKLNLLGVLKSEWSIDLPDSIQNLDLSALMNHLLGTVSGGGTGVTLFLDSCEAVVNPHVLRYIARAIESCPATVRFVLSGRTAIRVPRAKAVLSGELVRLSAQDLAFTRSEIARIADRWRGSPLAENELDAIYQKTGGWPVMLRLASLEWRRLDDPAKLREALSGANEIVSAYFMEEVLEKLPCAHRELLLKSSPLEVVSTALCRSATGLVQAASLLGPVDKRGSQLG